MVLKCMIVMSELIVGCMVGSNSISNNSQSWYLDCGFMDV